MSTKVQEPKGVPFYSVESGDTHYARLEPQIQAYINSSDMGINASRGQDYGWRLAPSWVKKVRAFREDEDKMARLTDRNGGQDPSTPQILYALYGEEVRSYTQRKKAAQRPFEGQYLKDIQEEPEEPQVSSPEPLPEVEKPSDKVEKSAEGEAENANQSDVTDPGAESSAKPSEEKPSTGNGNKPANSSQKSGNQRTTSKSKNG